MRPITTLLSIACCPGFLDAQCVQESLPPFAGGQFFVSMSDATGAPTGLLKCQGFTAVAPVVWPSPAPTPTTPDFDLDRAFRNLLTPSCSVGRTDPMPDIDAMSLGLDWVLATRDGFVSVPANAWGTLTFTVSRASRGASGSAIALEANRPEGPAADVFSYGLRGSVLPPYLVGQTVRAHDAPEMGLRGGEEIDGLDQLVPMYRADPAVQNVLALRLPQRPTLYFSVSAATTNRVPLPWWGQLGVAERTGAVVFQMTWDPSARRWGCVQPWRSARQLGLANCEDVDALAIDIGSAHMLFSTVLDTRCARRDQILYLDLNTDGDPAPVPYQTHTNGGDVPVSQDADLLGIDDVRAICSLDPLTLRRSPNSPAPLNVLRMTVGTPGTGLTFPGVPRTLHGTTFLDCFTGVPRLTTYGLGWPDGAPDAGFAAAFLGVPGVPAIPVLLATFPRNTAAPFCGDPREISLVIPPALRLQMPALRIELTWLALRSSSLRLGQAHPVAIDL